MDNKIRVAVDAMGGDNAPREAVKGAVAAAQEKENVEILLVGQPQAVEQELARRHQKQGNLKQFHQVDKNT